MNPVIVLVDGAFRPHYYHELQQELPAEWIVPEAPRDALLESARADLALVSDEFNWEVTTVLAELRRRGVPTLHVADGVVEWRNSWENPRSLSPEQGMPLFQPVLSDKIACIGRSQTRVLESWGNLGKCETVGVPRFDHLADRKPRARKPGEPLVILILTAKCPGFTPSQVERVTASLRDLMQWFGRHPVIAGHTLQPRWRLTMGLEQRLGIKNELRDTTGVDLATVLQDVDAVITTPSTAMLEGMLQGVPVALLDYNNCPHYVPAAWTITAQEQFEQVMSELINPPPAKMLYQDTILHDALECRSPAAPRMVQLAKEMIRIGHECRQRDIPLKFPRRILADEQQGHHLPEERFDLRALYPEHEMFANLDRVALQVELGHLRKELQRVVTAMERTQRRLEMLQQEEASPALRLFRKLRDIGSGRKSA